MDRHRTLPFAACVGESGRPQSTPTFRWNAVMTEFPPRPPHLDCGPCLVRDWVMDDRPALPAIANHRAVWRNLAHLFPHPYDDADAEAWLNAVCAARSPTQWAIEVDGRLAGGIGIDPGLGIFSKSAQIGYWLGEAWWGRGIATAALRAVTAHIMPRLDLVRLEARVFAWNPASMRVLEKCGYEREGLLRRSVFKDGEIIDAVLYARVA
jgi:RimJ/RimL family protein N-acetyltransferase